MTPRLAKSVADMAEFCPDLAFRQDAGTAGGWWLGELRPLRSLETLNELLDDLYHQRDAYTAFRGELRHLPDCQAEHHHHDWMARVRPKELLRPFDIGIYYSGGHDHPRCWVDGINQTNAQHLWGDGSLCPFMASEDVWLWSRHTVADFVGHVSVWLISWMVWRQADVWVAGEHASTPSYHLTHIRPNEQCWCRSGKKYHKCCMHQDQVNFARFGR